DASARPPLRETGGPDRSSRQRLALPLREGQNQRSVAKMVLGRGRCLCPDATPPRIRHRLRLGKFGPPARGGLGLALQAGPSLPCQAGVMSSGVSVPWTASGVASPSAGAA